MTSRFENLLSRGVVTLADSTKKLQALQVRLLASEVKDDVEHVEPYGFTAAPHPGAEAVALFVEGDRSHGLIISVADRRYRVRGLAAGEVAIYDDQGASVTLTRAGIVIDGGGRDVTLVNAPRLVTDGDVVADGISLNSHTHSDPQGGSTGAPA
jgi:phage baseplate assembly protein V